MITKLQPSQLINKIGKHIKKSIDGVYSIAFSPNSCDLKMVVYYQIPIMSDRPGEKVKYSDLKEMNLYISLTTYSNKIRVNLVEIHPEEQTLGHFTVGEKYFDDLIACRKFILGKIKDILYKLFEGYEFIF